MADLLNAPPGNEVWKVGDQWYVMYDTPDLADGPPVPLVWKINEGEQLDSAFGPDAVAKPDRTLTEEQFIATGAIEHGEYDELANMTEHPTRTLEANFENEAKIRPWLRSPEVLRLITAALYEGRQLTDAELKTTQWFQSRTAAERQWAILRESHPKQAAELKEDNERRVRNSLRAAGIDNASEELVGAIAAKLTNGKWSESKVKEQILAVTDPYSGIEIAPWLQEIMGKNDPELDQTRDGEDSVRDIYSNVLGGYVRPDDATVEREAGKLRNDPDAATNLRETLQKQLWGLFPEYDGRDVTFDQIAQPWKTRMANAWGQTVADDDPVLYNLIKWNDAQKADTYLRTEGLERGIGSVVQSAVKDLHDQTGGGVRRSVI